MKSSMNGSRGEILTHLKRRGPLAADELAAALGISGVAARQNLEHLEAEGLVSVTIERRPIGRPRHRYDLTEAAESCFPANYDHLALMLLEQVAEQDGFARIGELLEGCHRRLLQQQRPEFDGQEPSRRLEMLAARQNAAGYMAEVETRTDGSFVLRQHHCPLRRVARCFPQLCQQEQALFSELMEAEVTREEHIERGDRCCTFLIRPRHAS
jgi:predicted ArsR family transcriptional regulator